MSDEQLQSLTLLDMTDREVLLVVRDVQDKDGWSYAEDVATQLDIGGDHPARAVSSRLSWLVRYGALERSDQRLHATEMHPTGQRGWRLTELGLALATGKLAKGTQTTLERMDPGALVMTTRWLSQRIYSSNGTTGKLLDREYRYGTRRKHY